MRENLAPVILFTYNRLDNTKTTLEKLGENDFAKETELFIFSDGSKGEKDRDSVEEVRSYLKEFSASDCFKKIELRLADRNQGLANSIISGVSEIINQYGKAIVLEDDIVTSGDFLQYMNDALDYYSDDERIWSIAGYSEKLKSLENYEHDLFLSYRASCWGWATWKNRWETIDWDAKTYGTKDYYFKYRWNLMRGGNDMPSMLKAQMKGKIDSWAIRWCYEQSLQNKLAVCPTISKVTNEGFGNGVHCEKGMEKKYGVDALENAIKFEPLELDEAIIREYKKFHNLTLSGRITGKIKMELKCLKNRKAGSGYKGNRKENC